MINDAVQVRDVETSLLTTQTQAISTLSLWFMLADECEKGDISLLSEGRNSSKYFIVTGYAVAVAGSIPDGV